MFGTKENGQPGFIGSVLILAVAGAVLWAFFALLRWMVTTKEGQVTTMVAFGILLIVMAVQSFTGAPASASRTPAAAPVAHQSTSQQSNQGWQTVIRNGQICTTFNGQSFPCTPIR